MQTETGMPELVKAENHFMTEVYGWMALGLALTGIVAGYVANQPQLIRAIFGTRFVFMGLLIFQLVLVLVLASAVRSTASSVLATGIFLGYAALNGLTMSVIFLAYTQSSIATAFFATAGTFGAMSLYGYFTKTDLTAVGNMCLMALLGVIIASVVNMFFHNPTVMWITTYLGVLIFIGLTAYDTQKIKQMHRGDEDRETEAKEAISGALALYLDFINLFLELVTIMGKRRD